MKGEIMMISSSVVLIDVVSEVWGTPTRRFTCSITAGLLIQMFPGLRQETLRVANCITSFAAADWVSMHHLVST